MRNLRRRSLDHPVFLLSLSLLAVLGPGKALAQEATADTAVRIFVAPAAAGNIQEPDPLAGALPALIAEAVEAGGLFMASRAHDLAPETREALGLTGDGIGDPKALEPKSSGPVLTAEEEVRLLILPSLKRKGSAEKGPFSYQVSLQWTDLIAGEKGKASAKATGAAGLVDAVGEAVREARAEWSETWKPGAAEPQTGVSARKLSESLSSSPEALAAWARVGALWAGGEAGDAEAALEEALASDASFDRARVDLAWIRLARDRRDEAATLAQEALKGGRLTGAARARAEVLEAAAREDGEALEALGERYRDSQPGAPWGWLASGLARNLSGEHERAVARLDRVRLHRPNDPALLHQAGIAALGSVDYFDAVVQLERAAALWPDHGAIQVDLAEAKLRSQDTDGALAVLKAWRDRFKPSDPPVYGDAWSFENPPPPVRAVEFLVLQGSIEKAVETLDKERQALEIGGAPVELLRAVLMTQHELQMQLAFGQIFFKQRWLNAARTSFAELQELFSDEEKKARPWVLDRMLAHIRVREGRVDEAEEIRDRILEMSGLPGYDPGIEAEIDAAIALKLAETSRQLEACRRGIEARGNLQDHFRLAQAHAITFDWDKTEVQYKILEDRLEFWSAGRRGDSLLGAPLTTALVPFVYQLGAQAGVHSGRAEDARERFNIFLAYFRNPDDVFMPFRKEALDRGARPAW